MHVFEKAGLGKAPFKFLGTYESLYQAVPGDPSCPVQPGSSCDYCAQGIRYVYRIKGADGREFKVGCECVTRAGDAGLKKVIDAAKNKRERAKRHAKAATELEQLKELLAREDVKDLLATLPHPSKRAASFGRTLLDSVTWNLERAGAAGRKASLKLVLSALKTSR